MKNNNLGSLNSLIEKKTVERNGKHYVNLIATVVLNDGSVVSFEIQPKFYNRKFDYKLKQNLNECK